MKLTFDPLDLKPEHLRADGTPGSPHPLLSAREVTFDALTTESQKVLSVAGRGVYWSWDRSSYNAVFPPKDTNDPIPTWQEIQAALGCGVSAAQKKRNGARKVTLAEAVKLADELGRDLGSLVRALAKRRADWVKKQKERDDG
jgi:hypothetical protein